MHDPRCSARERALAYSLFDFGLDAAFLADLAALLRGMHRATHHPLNPSLRGGTQTLDNLLERREPYILRLRAAIEAVLTDWLRQLPSDDSHPFLGRRPERLRFTG